MRKQQQFNPSDFFSRVMAETRTLKKAKIEFSFWEIKFSITLGLIYDASLHLTLQIAVFPERKLSAL
jgi:hypothetical protein